MSEKKIIVVMGATGAQGGGMARAILNDPGSEFSVRAITRSAHSEKAKALAGLGAEVVEADVNNLESLISAFTGAYGAFLVSFHWEHGSAYREWYEITNMINASKLAHLQHVVYSTLEDTRDYLSLDNCIMPTLHNDFNVPHFDVKGQANHLFRELNIPTTFLLTSFYYENFVTHGLGMQKGGDGKAVFTLPLDDKQMPVIAAGDIGKAAYSLFRDREAFIGKTVGIAGDHLSGEEFAAAFSEALQEEVRYSPISHETFRQAGFPGADELGNMLQFKCLFNKAYKDARNMVHSRLLNPEMQSFRQWLTHHKHQLTFY